MENDRPLIGAAGVSMVDVLLRGLPVFQMERMQALGLHPGQQTIIDATAFQELYPQTFDPEYAVINPAGTYLNFFAALYARHRRQSILATTLDVDEANQPTRFAQAYAAKVDALCLRHHFQPTKNGTAVCTIFNCDTDRAMATYLGNGSQLSEWPQDIKPQYLYVEGYEATIKDSPLFKLNQQLIGQKDQQVMFGLSATWVVDKPEIKAQIQQLKDNNQLFALFGNEEEYKILLGLSDTEINLHVMQRPEIRAFFANIPNALITLGDKGMIGIRNGEAFFQEAVKPKNVTNTTGAGDATAGSFISAVLDGQDFPQCLQHAAINASKVIEGAFEPCEV